MLKVIVGGQTIDAGQGSDVYVPIGQISLSIQVVLTNTDPVGHSLGFVETYPKPINKSTDQSTIPAWAELSSGRVSSPGYFRRNAILSKTMNFMTPKKTGDLYNIIINGQMNDIKGKQSELAYHGSVILKVVGATPVIAPAPFIQAGNLSAIPGSKVIDYKFSAAQSADYVFLDFTHYITSMNVDPYNPAAVTNYQLMNGQTSFRVSSLLTGYSYYARLRTIYKNQVYLGPIVKTVVL